MKKIPTPQSLAVAFCQVLNEWLTPEQMATINERNASEPNVSICHSHDFCDANEAIAEAWALATSEELEFDASDNAVNDLLTEAWQLARDAEFNPEGVETFRVEGVTK